MLNFSKQAVIFSIPITTSTYSHTVDRTLIFIDQWIVKLLFLGCIYRLVLFHPLINFCKCHGINLFNYRFFHSTYICQQIFHDQNNMWTYKYVSHKYVHIFVRLTEIFSFPLFLGGYFSNFPLKKLFELSPHILF